MTELSKLFSTVLLLAAGFFGASMFGPPELTERLMGQWAAPQMTQGEGLRPLSGPLSPGPMPSRGDVATRYTPLPLPPTSVPTPSVDPASVSPAAVATVTVEPTRGLVSAWQTPDFAVKDFVAKPQATVATQNPRVDPSADFNAWLGAAGNWLDREKETASTPTPSRYQRDTAVAPVAGFNEPASPQASVAWLPPRNSIATLGTNGPSPGPSPGPSLFAANSNEQNVHREQVADDAWGAWSTNPEPPMSARFPAPLGPSPLDAPRRTYEAGYAPVARSATQANYGTHVVTDGDTLPDLAKRYLGDATRAEELYQLNRDRLNHPDLLPIGLVLRMPDEPRQATPPANDWSQQRPVRNSPFSTVSSGDDTFDEPSRMVPIGTPEEKPARLPNAMYADEWSW